MSSGRLCPMATEPKNWNHSATDRYEMVVYLRRYFKVLEYRDDLILVRGGVCVVLASLRSKTHQLEIAP